MSRGVRLKLGSHAFLISPARLSAVSMVPNCREEGKDLVTIYDPKQDYANAKIRYPYFFQARRTLHNRLVIWSPPVSISEAIEIWFPRMAKPVHKLAKAKPPWTLLTLIQRQGWPSSQEMYTRPNRRPVSQLTSAKQVPTSPNRCNFPTIRFLKRSKKWSQ